MISSSPLSSHVHYDPGLTLPYGAVNLRKYRVNHAHPGTSRPERVPGHYCAESCGHGDFPIVSPSGAWRLSLRILASFPPTGSRPPAASRKWLIADMDGGGMEPEMYTRTESLSAQGHIGLSSWRTNHYLQGAVDLTP